MARLDPAILAHLEWLGFVQPTGLVFSAPALSRAGAILPRDPEGQQRLRESVFTAPDGSSHLPDFQSFARDVLEWTFSPNGYAGTADAPIPDALCVDEYGERLCPDYAVGERNAPEGAAWQLLVRIAGTGQDLDEPVRGPGGFEVSPHGQLERLLRRTGVTAGLLFNGHRLRLISAPRGESSGWLDFVVGDMLRTDGRPIVAALRLLLGHHRLLAGPRNRRLVALLDDSRKFQNEVSERLAEQVLHALYELLRGFQAAHDASDRTLLASILRDDPDDVYRGLLSVILRLIFLFYAEERDVLPEDETFLSHYSLTGLYQRLREDAALYPDTMDLRYGAWAQLIALFRLVHDGAHSGAIQLTARRGAFFNPDSYPFLEGRATARQTHERVEPPLVPDGTVYRALEKLLVLDGERISYRALDVEQIGSVYETMMGFRLETASGPSVAIRAPAKHGAPTTVNLAALLLEPPAKRAKWLHDHTDRQPTDKSKERLAAATTLEDLHAALDSLVDKNATPNLVPPGAMVLQPSLARRRSGSHYTPRTLTEPIVRTTLEPILTRLRGPSNLPPPPDRILDLKVCDPAMGSGAFLVEACRQLGDALIESWHAHDALPAIPPDEDEVVFARRTIAQRCLYGVDRNPVAVDLSKVSLWLITLAKDHPFTFVDHALRHGDSLVGLSMHQLEAFNWKEDAHTLGTGYVRDRIKEHLAANAALRQTIRFAIDDEDDDDLRGWLAEAQLHLNKVRLLGDLVVTAFFDGTSAKERLARLREYADEVLLDGGASRREELAARREADPPLAPFHWPIEFPEVFERGEAGVDGGTGGRGNANGGFDVVVGNPPFAGKNTLVSGNPASYADWLKENHPESHGNADLVAHFFRRAFDLIRNDGTFGLIATNTIAQGDTRSTGLRWICNHGGTIFAARKRYKWPGEAAAVVVSVVHVIKGRFVGQPMLDDKPVPNITAFLFHGGGNDDPVRLVANAGKSFQGSIPLGMGFTFDDMDKSGVASPLSEMRRILEEHPDYANAILPYIGGEEVNSSPTHAYHRHIINFGELSEEECRRRWPELMAIVEEQVKPERMRNNREGYRRYWWQFGEKRRELYGAVHRLRQVLVCGQTSKYRLFTFLQSTTVYDQKLIVIATNSWSALTNLQSRTHEQWSQFFGSTLEDRGVYTPSDCFETFPFPPAWESDPALEAIGKEYYEFRAELMVRNNEGMTKTYNRFHDPNERDPDIERLRELHAAMDRAVLEAYGWGDIPTECEFLLDYEEDEEGGGGRKKPWRLRWPDEVRDEVLARLLELNAARAREEALSGVGAGGRKGGAGGAGRRRTGVAEVGAGQGRLL